SARLLRASGRVVLGIKIQNDFLAAQIFQTNYVSFAVSHRKLRGLGTFFEFCCHCLSPLFPDLELEFYRTLLKIKTAKDLLMTAKGKNYWLVKQEPEDYSWNDLVREGSTAWTGVRNFQARNNLREMKPDDPVLFYHSGKE